MKGTIIYFGDPMCSWCYGYAQEITKIKNSFQDLLNFKMVMGGLRPGGKETIEEIGDFLRHHWKEVEQRSGQKFNYDILQKYDFTYDTEPPCRAVVTVRDLDQRKEFEFFKRVQKAFYLNGADTNDPETYVKLANELKLDPNKFMERFESDKIKQKCREDFIYSQNLGVRGFPTTVLEYTNALYLLAQGYDESTRIKQRIEKILSHEEAT